MSHRTTGFAILVLLLLQTILSASAPPVAASDADPEKPSKVAYIVQDRIRSIGTAFALKSIEGALPQEMAEVELSDSLIQVDRQGQLLLEFHAAQAISNAELESLKAFGAQITTSTKETIWPQGIPALAGYGVVAAWMPYDQVESAAAMDWVVAVTTFENSPPDAGAFLSEGVELHSADDLQDLGIDGTGVTVGAISDGINSVAASQASSDLPAIVTVPMACGSAGGDEGTAMLEIIHDMAPGAALQFCATGGGAANHVAAQNALVANGVDILTEDIPFDTEPAFQQGSAAVNGDNIAASGVTVYSSSGNRGLQHADRILATGTGGGPDGAAGPFAGCPATPDNVVAIAPGGDTTFDVTVRPGANGTTLRVTLQWSEPRAIFPTAGAGGFTDLNLYVMDNALTTCLGSSAAVQADGAGDTIEQVSVAYAPGAPNANVKIVVDVEGATGAVATPIIDLRWRGRTGMSDPPTREGSLNPDANYIGLATSVAAADASVNTDPTLIPLEGFSSGGPVQLQLTTICPAAYPCPGSSVAGPAATAADAPHWTAADGVAVSGVGPFGTGTCPALNQGDCQFYGTSAAAPHAAACDALIRDNVTTALTVADISARLAASAVDRGVPGYDTSWGFGVLDCLRAAIQSDLDLTKVDNPDPVAAGTVLTYTLAVTNNGPDHSPGLVVTDTLPAEVSFISGSPGCAETVPGSGIVSCSWGNLPVGETVSSYIVVAVPADLVFAAGAPITITNTATVKGIGLDTDPNNNDVMEQTAVVAIADLEILAFEALSPPSEILVGEDVMIMLHKLISNRGPSAPMNVAITQTATAPADSVITPAVAVSTEPALGLDEEREVSETFTVTCGAASQHIFGFGNEIQPLDPADVDPDQSDNSATIDLEMECVVPVAVNIKPGSDPNSINLKNNGSIPLAILSTSAGEYGTPLDFDATAIDPLSVRFGPRDLVWTETGGAFEVHNRGHVEDAYELDEMTLDGDYDTVLHFRTRDTGIQVDDTEACVKGTWTDTSGVAHKFFGCDAIRTDPGANAAETTISSSNEERGQIYLPFFVDQ